MPFPYVALAPGPKPATGASFGDGLSNDMVYMHAVFVRGLNSIYSQALSPKIPAEVTAFANYSLTWAALLEHHHLGEEKFLFPFLAKQFPDEMARNESEHEVFATGLVTFKAYMEGVVTGTQVFKGEEVREILATFADKVVKHLNDEIPTLQLEVFAKFNKEETDQLGKAFRANANTLPGLTTSLVFMVIHHDYKVEPNWPPVPAPVRWVVRNVLYRRYANWWAFAPFDRSGAPRVVAA